jgi:thiamine-phosphate pyrophosphorylase
VSSILDQRATRLTAARLYLVCSTRPGDRALRDVLDAALGGGVDVLQLRDKQAANRELLGAAAVARELCDEHDVLLILNDRPDLVGAARADGCHVGQDDVTVADARALAGPDALVGLSTHTPQQVDGAAGVDYIGVGPVHATPTKPGRPAVGLDLVRYAAAHAAVPFFAIGGIDASNADAVIAAGAHRIAVVRAIAEAADPREAAASLRATLAREPVHGLA